MSFLVVANFKSNQTQAEVESWLKAVTPSQEMVIAPAFPHLSLFTGKLENWKTGKHLCAQDVSPFPLGSYTGAVNAQQLKDLGVEYCIVGHSERRRYFHETSVEIASKVRELVSQDILPILCMEGKDVIPQFAALSEEYYQKCIYCFEPVEDIGGTTTASLGEIEEVKTNINNVFPGAKFMYGGSVNADNITSLLSLDLSGVLVATASLDPESYLRIMAKVKHAE